MDLTVDEMNLNRIWFAVRVCSFHGQSNPIAAEPMTASRPRLCENYLVASVFGAALKE
jgi:hypothetical protein